MKDRYFYSCLEKAGLRRIRFHDLRHHADSRIMPTCDGGSLQAVS